MSILTKATLSKCLRFGFSVAILGVLLIWPSHAARADKIATWNFNDSDLAVDTGSGSLVTSFPTFGFATGTPINARLGDTGGQALSLSSNANNGQNITLSFSTIGFGGILLSFATQRTSTGFNSNQLQYSLDGTTFVDFDVPYDPPTAFALVAFDLSSIAGLGNNPNAILRIVFNGATSSGGNNRLDNLVLEGTPLGVEAVPEPATMALLGTGLVGLAAARRRKKKRS